MYQMSTEGNSLGGNSFLSGDFASLNLLGWEFPEQEICKWLFS